jgi:hypothetical protein
LIYIYLIYLIGYLEPPSSPYKIGIEEENKRCQAWDGLTARDVISVKTQFLGLTCEARVGLVASLLEHPTTI